MSRIFFLSILMSVSLLLHAQESTVVLEPRQAKEMEAKMCVDRRANDCVNTVCLTSRERDCIEKCHLAAKEKCKDMGQEVENMLME